MNKIIIAGSINMDLITRVTDLPLAGETIHGYSVEYLAGGKGLNQAVAAAKMDVPVLLAGRLGNDIFAESLYQFIKKHRINTDYLQKCGRESGTAFITVADNGQNTIVVVPGSNAEVSPADIEHLPINPGDICISQFEIPLPTVAAFFAKARNNGARTLLNPSPIRTIPPEIMALTDILIVNETELGFLKKEPLTDDTPLAEITAAARAIRINDGQTVIVTLGSKGALIVGAEIHRVEGHAVTAIDTVGAGDCFAGVAAAQLLRGEDIRRSVEIANHAASICVTRKGAAPSMPEAHELPDLCRNGH